MCWHDISFLCHLCNLISHLLPLFHSFGPLQKITTITVTVMRLCIFCVLWHLHEWLTLVSCTVLLYLFSLARQHIWLNETEFSAANVLMYGGAYPAVWIAGVSWIICKTSCETITTGADLVHSQNYIGNLHRSQHERVWKDLKLGHALHEIYIFFFVLIRCATFISLLAWLA